MARIDRVALLGWIGAVAVSLLLWAIIIHLLLEFVQ